MEIIPARSSILHLNVAMIVVTGVAVSVRFLIRARSKASFAGDDWWLLSSLVSFYVFMGIQTWCKYISGTMSPQIDNSSIGIDNVHATGTTLSSLLPQLELLAKVITP